MRGDTEVYKNPSNRMLNLLRMGNGQFTCTCLNRGVEKSFLDVQNRPEKANNSVRILLFLHDTGHVTLARPCLTRFRSTKVLFSCSLIRTICILVASAEVPVTYVVQSSCNLLAIPNIC